MKTQIEKWIDAYYFPEKYEVSSFGKVRNKITKKIYKISIDSNGYKIIMLREKGQRITTRLHRLVYLSFNPSTPLSLNIHHLDHDKSNNKLSNLGAIDHKTHASIHAKLRISYGTFTSYKKGSKNFRYKGRVIALCPETYKIKHIMCGSYEMKSLGFCDSGVSRAVNNYTKHYKKLFFKRIPDNLNVKIGDIFDLKS
jgi:hypothetical protein